MKKILVVCGSLKIGGLETVAFNCMKYADLGKYSFSFLLFDKKKGEYEHAVEKRNCQIIRVKRSANPFLYYLDLTKIIRTYGPFDIVHSHNFFSSAIVMLAAKTCGVEKRIAHAHSIKRAGTSFITSMYYSILRLIFKDTVTTMCACSNKAGTYMFGKEFLNKGIVVPNIVDSERFAFSPQKREAARKEFGIGDDCVVVGQVGRLSIVKNPLFLIDVFHKFQMGKNAKLLMVGDGNMMKPILDKVNKCGLSDKVILTGARTDVDALLSAMDIFVCTSTNEGLGIVLIEALANGLNVIVEKDAVVDEVIKLQNISLVEGFDNLETWVEAVNNNIIRPNNVDSLIKKIYSNENLSRTLEQIYS